MLYTCKYNIKLINTISQYKLYIERRHTSKRMCIFALLSICYSTFQLQLHSSFTPYSFFTFPDHVFTYFLLLCALSCVNSYMYTKSCKYVIKAVTMNFLYCCYIILYYILIIFYITQSCPCPLTPLMVCCTLK